jgi:hypothetical protein
MGAAADGIRADMKTEENGINDLLDQLKDAQRDGKPTDDIKAALKRARNRRATLHDQLLRMEGKR